jgi:competence protein CoiA
MKFAIVGGKRTEPTPKTRGTCPKCCGKVIAKCGRQLVWHWAHKAVAHCDPWWESETEWHRQWKDRFPSDWQEVVLVDQKTDERHVADVRTTGGLVIEFQRSSIEPREVAARESFYRTMIWIIDGRKNDADRYNFSNMRSRPDKDGLVNFKWHGRSKLFAKWHTLKPIFIDFGPEHGFWRILRFNPDTKAGLASLVNIDGFVSLAISGTTDFSASGGPASPW